MGKKLTKDILRIKIEQRISELSNTEIISINYLDNNLYNSTITLKCTAHNEVYTISYPNLIDRRHSNHCKTCISETNIKSHKHLQANQEEEITKLKIYLEEANKNGSDLEFVDIVDEWRGLVNTKILIRCNKHNTVTETTILNVTKRGNSWNCPDCMKELKSNSPYTPREARERLENKFPDSKLDFSKVEKTFKNCESEVIVECLEHGEFKRKYSLLYNSVNPTCPSCMHDVLSKANMYTEAQAEDRIKRIIDEKNNNGASLEFLGFVGNKWCGQDNTDLIIKCTKHNLTLDPVNYHDFCGYNLYCPECVKEKIGEFNSFTPDEAFEIITSAQNTRVDGISYKLDKIKETYSGSQNKVTIECEIHGEFEQSFNTLARGGGYCPECLKQHLSELNSLDEEIVMDLINERINELKSRGHTIQFQGFAENDKTRQTNRHLKLYCVEHNRYWETTNFNYFVKTPGALFCPDCVSSSGGGSISEKEQYCINETNKHVPWSDMDTQLEISLDDETKALIHHEEKIKVDIYIKSINAMIEYNGGQHYQHTPFYQDLYSDFIDQVNRDEFLRRYCKENNIKLLIIPYKDDKRIPEIIEKFIKEGIDITTKVEVKPLPPAIYQETCRSLIKLGDG